MAFFNRKLYRQKPKQWGPASLVRASIFKNADRAGIDPALFEFVLPIWEAAGSKLFNYAGKIQPTHTTSLEHNYLNFTGNASQKIDCTNAVPYSSKITILVTSRIFSDASDQRLGGRFPAGSGLNEVWGLWYDIGDGAKGYVFQTKHTSSVGDFVSTGLTKTSGSINKFETIVGRVDLRDASLFVAGKHIETLTLPGNLQAGTDAPVYFGHLQVVNQSMTGNISQVLYLNGALTDGQIAHLSDNPYVLLQRVAPVYYSVPATGPVTFKPFWARNATRII